jgi:hypothetical protein
MSTILQLATDYFRLQLNDNNSAGCTTLEEDREYILSSLEDRLTAPQAASIDRPITAEEVYTAIERMPRGRTPGPDGIPTEFYLISKLLVIPLLTEVCSQAWAEGNFPSDFLRGDIVLLPKKGDKETDYFT